MAVWNACKKSYPLTRPVATVWHLQKGVPRLHPPVNDAIGLCGQSGSKAHLTEEGTATATPYSSDEISRHANRSELVDSALDFALQLLAFAFHFLRFSFAAYFRVSALLLDLDRTSTRLNSSH